MTERAPMQKTNSTQIALPFWRQLSWNLIVSYALSGVLPVLIATVAILNRTGSQAIDQVYNQLDSVAELKSDQILRWLDEGNLAMDTLLSGPNAEKFTNFTELQTSGVQEQTEISEILAGAVESQYFNRLFVYNESGIVVASSDPADVKKNITEQPYFEISLHADYIQSPIPDPSTERLVMYITRPIRSGKIQASGVLVGELNIDTLAEIMTERTGLGESGETYLVNLQNNNLLTPSRFEGYEMNAAYHSEGIDQGLEGIKGRGAYNSYRPVTVFGSYRFIPELQAALLAEVEQSQALAAYRQAQWVGVLIALIAMVVSIGAGFFSSSRISRPIRALTVSAQRVGAGDLSTEVVELRRQDEIGVLARAFQQMQHELASVYQSLEQRVADRTKALSSVAEISTAVSTILEPDRLLQKVVDLSKDRFGFYHAHIYLLNDAGDTLVLKSGAGEVGRLMVAEGRSIPLDREQSLVARAAREKNGVTVNDVTQAPDFLPNPLLPDTRSEMAVPMMVGEQIIGVFDVQSEVIGRFTDADIAVQTTLASQIAAAVQNARSYTKVTEAEELTRTIIDSTNDWIFVKDRQHRYGLVNAGYSNALHIPVSNFLGKDDLDLGFPEELVKGDPEKGIRGFWADDNLVFETGKTQHYPNDPATIDGVVHVFDTLKIPLRNADGQVWAVLGFARDVTERERTGELLKHQAFQQEAINLITQKIQSTGTVEAALQVAARELGRALGHKPTIVALEPKDN